jgi:pSer/pThr/pTyr-binding forkhead associated (FHA) protein
VLRDLNSTNGTFINGQQLTGEAVIKSGQIIRLGQVEMRLENAEPKAAAAAAKRLPDQTMVIPQGVKLGQDPPTKVLVFDSAKSGFAKKKNTGTKIFIGVAVGVFLILIGVIVYLVKKAG